MQKLYSPVHTGDKVDFNTVDCCWKRQQIDNIVDCCWYGWDFVANVYGDTVARSTFHKVDRVEFNFVACVYRALQCDLLDDSAPSQSHKVSK